MLLSKTKKSENKGAKKKRKKGVQSSGVAWRSFWLQLHQAVCRMAMLAEAGWIVKWMGGRVDERESGNIKA